MSLMAANPSPQDHAPDGIDLIAFRAGPLNLGLERCGVLGMERPGANRTPHIGDLLFDQPSQRQPLAHDRLLRIAHPRGTLRLCVSEPVRLCHLPSRALHALPRLLAARSAMPWVRALAFADPPQDEILLLILDPGLLPPPDAACWLTILPPGDAPNVVAT